MTTEAQLSTQPLKLREFAIKPPEMAFFYQILGSKTVKNVKIDPQTTEIWLIKLNVTL